jgi:hypothetical protein
MPSRTADGGRRRIGERGGLRTNSGHVAARVRAAAIFGPDVVPTPARCHNGIWAGVSGSLIGSPGQPGRDLDLQCRAAEGVADDRQLRPTVDDQLGCRFAVLAGEHIERDAHPNPLGIFWARTRFTDLSTVSEMRKRRCAILAPLCVKWFGLREL